MTRYTSIALALMAAIMLLAGCGSSKFKQGEKVWIALDGQTISKDGHAEGIVVGAKENLVQVQVSNIAADNKNDLLPSLRVGQATYIPTKQVYTVEKGQQRADQRHKLLEDFLYYAPSGDMMRQDEQATKSTFEAFAQHRAEATKKYESLSDRAANAHVPGIAAAAAIVAEALKKGILTAGNGDDSTLKKRVTAGLRYFSDIKSILERYHLYGEFTGASGSDLPDSASINQLMAQRFQQVLGGPRSMEGVSVSQWVSTQPAVRTAGGIIYIYSRSLVEYRNSASVAKAAQLNDMLDDLTESNVAIAQLLLGTQLSAKSTKDIRADLKSRLVYSIRSDVQDEVTNDDGSYKIYKSVVEAKAAYRALKKKVKPAENALNMQILTKKDEQQYFVNPTKTALEAAKKAAQRKREAAEIERTLIAVVSSSNPYEGVSGTGGSGDAKFIIRFTDYDSSNHTFTGTMEWPDFKLAVTIQGMVILNGSASTLRFKEVHFSKFAWRSKSYLVSLKGDALFGAWCENDITLGCTTTNDFTFDDSKVRIDLDANPRAASTASTRQYKVRHILVPDKKTAEHIIDKLNNGADFATLAKKASTGPSAQNGGELGWFSSSEMPQPFVQAVKKLDKSEYTKQPVKTRFGWHVILLQDSRAP